MPSPQPPTPHLPPYNLTRDPLSLGLIGLAEALPFIGVALPAGYLADRRDRRAISVAMLLVLACCSAALVAFSATPGLLTRVGVVPIYATIFVSGIARGILQPARQALGAEIIRDLSTRMPSPGAAAPGRPPR